MIEEIKEDQNKVLLTLKEEYEISNISYNTWLGPLKPHPFKDNIITIIVPEQAFLQYVNKKYGFLLKVTISGSPEKECEMGFKVKEQIVETEKPSTLQLIKNNKVSVSPDVIQSANLDPKYTFDTLVVGGNNNLVHAAVLVMAESPGEIYNPFFIYGGVEFGKTRLVHAITHFVLKNNAKSRILYAISKTSTNELIDTIRNKNNVTIMKFRERCRNNDVLLTDNIQFIISGESTQEELLHIFNTLYELEKQVIVSPDKPPKKIETLKERLRSCFEWSLTVDIQSPDYETRMAILHRREEMEGCNTDNEVIRCIATNVKSNIREPEGALTKIVVLSRLNKCDITLEPTEETLKDIIPPNTQRGVTSDLIIQVVSNHFGLTPLDVSSQKRNKEIVYPRQIVMYLRRDMTATPLRATGRYLGGGDHATAMYGAEKVTGDTVKDNTLRNATEILKKKINPQQKVESVWTSC